MGSEDPSVRQMQQAGARVLQSTQGLAEKVSSPVSPTSTANRTRTGGKADEREAIIEDLKRQLGEEQDKNRSLEDQIKYRVASFVKRESQTKSKIEALERRLNEGTDQDEHKARMHVIENMHKSIIGGLDCIQNNTAKILQDQEKDLMRAFRARLQDVSKDLEAQRSRKGEHSTELQARHRRVVAELHEAQELAQTFDRKNQQLDAENKRLRVELRTRKDDRDALLKELVLSRKECAKLREKLKEDGSGQPPSGNLARSAAEDAVEEKRTVTQRQVEQARLMENKNQTYEREVGYRDALKRLKRTVEAERQLSRDARSQLNTYLQQRVELETLLQQSLDDVKAEITKHQAIDQNSGPRIPGDVQAALSVQDLSTQDRERVLELLLSQQRVVQLLYSKTFPTKPPDMVPQEPKDKDDFSWLGDIIPSEK